MSVTASYKRIRCYNYVKIRNELAMDLPPLSNSLQAGILLKIIQFQQQIIKLGPDFTAVMTEAAQGAQQLTASDGAVIEIIEEDELVYRAASTSSIGLLGTRISLEGSLSGACIKSGHSLVCSDTEQDARVDREATRRVGVRSMIVSPLIFDGACVGVLKVFSQKRHAFDAHDTAIVDIISSTISASMFQAAKTESSRLFHIATHDFLTGVANRSLLHDRLKLRITQAARDGEPFAIIMVDMDKLKLINDRYGHRFGDRAIQLLAQRLSQYARTSDTVARIGGDEFAILLHQIQDEESVKQVCQRLIDALVVSSEIEGTALNMQASMGYAIFPDNGKDIETLMEHADKSMYANKRSRICTGDDGWFNDFPVI